MKKMTPKTRKKMKSKRNKMRKRSKSSRQRRLPKKVRKLSGRQEVVKTALLVAKMEANSPTNMFALFATEST